MPPIRKEQAFVLLALHTLRRPCAGSYLQELYAATAGDDLEEALNALETSGKIRRQTGTECLWEGQPLPEAEAERLAAVVRIPETEQDNSHLLGYLYPECSLDECERALHFMMGQLYSHWASNMNLYVDLVITFLSAWAEQHRGESGPDNWKFVNLVLIAQCFSVYSRSNLRRALVLNSTAGAVATAGGNERFTPFLTAMSLYLTSLSRYPGKEAVEAFAEQVEKAGRLSEPALDKLMPWLWGMLYFLRGEYPQVVNFHRRTTEQPHWWYRRLFSIQALNTLYSANYLGLYHLAAGIGESARNTASLGGESAVSLVYHVQHCFLYLRIRETEKARKGLEHVMNAPGYAASYVLRSLCARVMALYHYMEDDVHAAHSLLSREVRLAMEEGLDVSPFHDPFILDMLYVFEQHGLPPIPRYTLDALMEILPYAANTHLRGAALRIQAMRDRDRGMAPARVVELLRESLQQLEPSGDPRELALTAHELATALERIGQRDEALQIRRDLAQFGNMSIDAATDYRQASIVCLNVAQPFATHMARGKAAALELENLAPPTGRTLLARCHKAFHEFPIHEGFGDMCLALVKIAQAVLDAEQVALFAAGENGQMLCKAAVNVTSAELESQRMQPWLQWLRHVLQTEPPSSFVHHTFGLCLLLDVNGSRPWILSSRNHLTEGLIKYFNHNDLQDLARLFAAEIRSCLRMDSVRDAAISSQYVRLKNIVAIKEEGAMPPLLGDGLQTLMRKALQVSSTDAPILLWGETGVGKEIMARQIHELSECSGPFVAIHPASMPETLFESECFGYERGAFTGAGKQKLGLFELADRGTLFIDEIGEISPLIQTKLLRVLQEKRFMRVGGTHEIASRFRLVVATNRDLWQEVAEGNFRQDLLYRISVVPLKIPALRERKQDIIPLATAFIAHFSRHHGKSVVPLTAVQTEQLYAYDWPGNIRELRNSMERAVILSTPGEPLVFELSASNPAFGDAKKRVRQSLAGEAHERTGWNKHQAFAALPSCDALEEQYLRYVMEVANGHVCGEDGAAALLQMKQSTLYAKLRKHNIILRPRRGAHP